MSGGNHILPGAGALCLVALIVLGQLHVVKLDLKHMFFFGFAVCDAAPCL